MRMKWGKTLDTQMVPFSGDGNQMTYPDEWSYRGLTWKPNSVFVDTLRYDSYGRGRSAAYFELLRTDGTCVTVFMTDIGDIIRQMDHGVITGTFTFCKRGQNYGCKLVSDIKVV